MRLGKLHVPGDKVKYLLDEHIDAVPAELRRFLEVLETTNSLDWSADLRDFRPETRLIPQPSKVELYPELTKYRTGVRLEVVFEEFVPKFKFGFGRVDAIEIVDEPAGKTSIRKKRGKSTSTSKGKTGAPKRKRPKRK